LGRALHGVAHVPRALRDPRDLSLVRGLSDDGAAAVPARAVGLARGARVAGGQLYARLTVRVRDSDASSSRSLGRSSSSPSCARLRYGTRSWPSTTSVRVATVLASGSGIAISRT